MNKDTLELIKKLSSLDRKTLSQKALKTCEEVGELARAILPFEGAHGTNHRFTDKEDVAEEAVDVIICALSILYKLDIDDSLIEDLLKEKSNKWSYLIGKEDKFSKGVPYEIHITVSADDLNLFRTVCRSIDVKPIILDLQDKQGNTVMKDVMTSSVFFGNNKTAYAEMCRISESLSRAGFHILRNKIETVPWHPAAPQAAGDKMPEDCYFESHLAVICDDQRMPLLKELAEKKGCHLSSNVFKSYDDGSFKIMLTLRGYDGTYASSFREGAEKVQLELEEEGFTVDKLIVEFSVYDTKFSHDNSWTKAVKE